MENLLSDFVFSVFRNYFGLYFDVVDSDENPQNYAFLTSGPIRLQIHIRFDQSNVLDFPIKVSTKIFGKLLFIYIRLLEDSLTFISESEVLAAVAYLEDASRLHSEGVFSENVKLITMELPDLGEINNRDITIAISQQFDGLATRIPTYFGRLGDGSVFAITDDNNGRSRYIQIELCMPLPIGLVKSRLENVGIKLSDDRLGCRVQCNYFTDEGRHQMHACMRHF